LAYLGVIQNLGIVAFLLAGVVLLLVGGLLMLIGYLGALVKLAQLSQWVWFVLLLLFSVITMFAYIFAGPTASKGAKV
jgi:energy-coupling factor transporter transmembrane protein EcfT